MSEKKTILVTGATGEQGGSVARALLRENKFHVRVLTRNLNDQKAVLLQRAGAEIFKGDMNDIDSLHAAMKNVYGIFGVTNYWEHFQLEYQLGKNLVDVAEQAGIEHVVLHTMPSYHQVSNGGYSVPHHDLKAQLETYTRDKNIPATFVGVGFYYENFLNLFSLQKDNKDGYYFGFPQGNTKLAAASVEDIGGVVAPVFDQPEKYIARNLFVTGSDLTPHDYAGIMSKVLNKNIYYTYIPRNVYAAYDFPGAEELANMFEVQRLYIPNRQAKMEESYRINPAMQSFENWMQKNKGRFIQHFNSLYEVGII